MTKIEIDSQSEQKHKPCVFEYLYVIPTLALWLYMCSGWHLWSTTILATTYAIYLITTFSFVYMSVKHTKQLIPTALFGVKRVKKYFSIKYIIIVIFLALAIAFTVLNMGAVFMACVEGVCDRKRLYLDSLTAGVLFSGCLWLFLIFFFMLTEYRSFQSRYTESTKLNVLIYYIVFVSFVIVHAPLLWAVLWGTSFIVMGIQLLMLSILR